jgi:hypothetical protein
MRMMKFTFGLLIGSSVLGILVAGCGGEEEPAWDANADHAQANPAEPGQHEANVDAVAE